MPSSRILWHRLGVILPVARSLHNLAIVAVQKVLDVAIDTAFAELPFELLLAQPTPGRVKHKDLVKQHPISVSLLAPMAVKVKVFVTKIVARSHIVFIALSNEILLAVFQLPFSIPAIVLSK